MAPPLTGPIELLSPEQRDELEARLAVAGYQPELSADGGGLSRAAREYAEFHDLPADPVAILKHSRLPRCSRPDRDWLAFDTPVLEQPLAIEFGRWGEFTVSVSWRFGRIPDDRDTLTVEEIEACWRALAVTWMTHCGVQLEIRPGAESANIFATDANLGGPYGVLAWSHLPPGVAGPSDVMQQRYDFSERWNRDFFYRTALHEVGHALGLPHGRGNNVMAPSLHEFPTPFAGGGSWLGADDIRRVQGLGYGPSRQTPPPGPGPTPPTPPGPGPIPPPGGKARGSAIFDLGAAGRWVIRGDAERLG